MARSMLSLGMLTARALLMASCNLGFISGSPPPLLAATVIMRAILVKILPFLASVAPFLCFILAQCECPANFSYFSQKPFLEKTLQLNATFNLNTILNDLYVCFFYRN